MNSSSAAMTNGNSHPTPRLLSVLMPIYNERPTLRTIVRRVLASPTPIPLELIAVDDCSQDGSAEILRELAAADPRVRPIFHEKNTGKGGAIHTAIAHMKGDVAVVQDADLEYDPAELPRLLQPILEGKADAVFGSRFLPREYRRVLYYWHSLGNQMLTWLCNLVSNLNLTDMETCYKMVRADILKNLRLHCQRFGLEPELTIRLAQWGARIYEVPINYAGRTYLEGKKITWRDGFRALATIGWCGFIDKRFTNHDGYYILASVRNANKFNRWMFEQIRPFVGQRVMEAGCGIGNLTELMLHRERLVCVDIDPIYLELIERRFGLRDNFRCFRLDLADVAAYAQLKDEAIDSIICLNVLEHIPDDMAVLQRFYDALEPGGRAIILVPQHPWLYTRVDQTLGHCRRYTADELRRKMSQIGFEVIHEQGFNKLGTLGWFVSGNILRHQHLTPGQMKTFNRVLPIARAMEKVPGLPAQSLIMVGRKPGGAAVPAAGREMQASGAC